LSKFELMIDQTKNNEKLDLSYLIDMSGDSAEFMIEMLEVFQKQTPIYMAELELAVNERDWKATYECAHKIKPTFYYVGREDARDHMQEIEHNAREQVDVATIPDLFAEVAAFVKILYQQLETAKAELQERL
jgi:HPt (histidine-containing phosphotransfer) domain-containing protein